MEGPVLMECYEDVFEEIAAKFYSDEPLTKSLPPSEHFMMATRFSGRLRPGGGMPLSLHPPPQYLNLGLPPASTLNPVQSENTHALTNGDISIKSEGGSSSETSERTSTDGGGGGGGRRPKDGDNQTGNSSSQEETWIESRESLSWSNSKVARYNPASKMYRCVDCETVGFLSRIAEHWLGAHANLKVFRCPRCPYSSAWARCVRMHLTRHHNEQHSDATLWKDNTALDEVTRFLQSLRNSVENKDDGSSSSNAALEPLSDKRYACPQCPYATDRRDLYTRHENIHKDDKPFHCYVCYKMFSRADHVKKHFFRMHKDRPYDINLIRRHPPKPNSTNNINPNNINNNNNSTTTTNNHHHNHATTLQPYYNNSLPTLTPLPQAISNSISANGMRCMERSSSPELEERYSGSKKKRLPKMFTCTYCSWRGVDNWCLKRHLNTHIKPYLCVLCDYKAARAERLSTHVLKIHNKRICNKCSFLAEDQNQLNRHIRETHSHERSLMKCDDCPETFDSQSDFETHGILVHNRDLLDCDYCDYKTTHPGNLQRHLSERHPLMEDGETRLVSGVAYHGGRKEIRCRTCGCEFANQSSLQTHCLLLHRNERSGGRFLAYTCSVCHYACASQTTMMEHMRVHTGETLQCQAEQCVFRTPFDAVLREHVQFVHNDDFTIRCPHCGLAASTWSNVGRHFPSHHPRPCAACLAVIRKHFPGRELVPLDLDRGATGSTSTVSSEAHSSGSPSLVSQVDFQVITQVKRSRKQSQPRKCIQTSDDEEDEDENDNDEDDDEESVGREDNNPPPSHCSSNQLKWVSQVRPCSRWTATQPQHKCRLCAPNVAYYHKKHLILHSKWRHTRKLFKCEHCSLTYKHQYQVLLHASRSHVHLHRQL